MSSRSSTSRLIRVHPLDAPCVALAMEAATPTDAGTSVPAIRALKFQGQRVLERLEVLLEHAGGKGTKRGPADAFVRFVGDAPLVAHDVPEVFARLEAHGVKPANVPWDTQELAALLLPGVSDYSVAGLSQLLFGETVDHEEEPDAAEAVHRLYLGLVDQARALGPSALHSLGRYTAGVSGPLSDLLAALAEAAPPRAGIPGGIDHRELSRRLGSPRAIGAPREPTPVSPDEVEALLSTEGPLAQRFPRYEARPEQVAMARAVAEALGPPGDAGAQRLLVEGGTGIGKSVAYLLPAILFALRNNARVVVSTNTINLQEQLFHKDIPDLLSALSDAPGTAGVERFRYAQLKGKGNYLCIRRWEQLAAAESLTPDEGRTISKTLVWLNSTKTGDRAELRLRGRELDVWDRLSAAGFSTCPGAREGACFYRHARESAAAAHLVVVNHALLLSDLLVGGTLLPEHDYLIVDEAHNLEGEATHQFGFHVSQSTVEEMVERFSSIVGSLGSFLRVAPLDGGRRETLQRRMAEAQLPLYRVRDQWAHVVATLAQFVAEQRPPGSDEQEDLRITAASRSQPGWSDLEVVWDNFDHALTEAERQANALLHAMEGLPDGGLPGAEETTLELGEWLQHQAEVRQRIADFVARPDDSTVYWVGLGGRPLTMNGAPLEVATQLRELLFAEKQGVVLTSATLAVRGRFDHMRQRLGLDEPTELCLGSPFDYRQAALLCLPVDMPEPSAARYAEGVTSAIRALALAAGGYTMVLFTSHAAVRASAQALREDLPDRGVAVLAQGVDGTPQQLLGRFQDDPRAVLLGTASFWEGVDVGNSALKVLVVARLPFNVPTEPVFAARSEQYDQPFTQFAVPQAVLRFRQGFGRLVRNKEDRGVVVLLDSRVRTRSYGRWFLESLPEVTSFQGPMDRVVERVGRWLAQPPGRVEKP